MTHSSVPERHEAPDVVELRRLAEAATPGPWSLTDGDPAMSGQHWTIRRQGVPGIRVSGFTYGFNGDATYIAAANPAVVLGLLDRLAHMTEARNNARAEVERLAGLLAEVREWIDRRGVNVGDRDDDYMRGYRDAQRHALQDAAELRTTLDAEDPK